MICHLAFLFSSGGVPCRISAPAAASAVRSVAKASAATGISELLARTLVARRHQENYWFYQYFVARPFSGLSVVLALSSD